MGKTGRLIVGSILVVLGVIFITLFFWIDYYHVWYIPRALGFILLLMLFSSSIMAIVGIILIVFGLRSEKPIVQLQMQPMMPPVPPQPIQQSNCSRCGYPLTFIESTRQWYCSQCGMFVQ